MPLEVNSEPRNGTLPDLTSALSSIDEDEGNAESSSNFSVSKVGSQTPFRVSGKHKKSFVSAPVHWTETSEDENLSSSDNEVDYISIGGQTGTNVLR